jgi:hypothetical protein
MPKIPIKAGPAMKYGHTLCFAISSKAGSHRDGRLPDRFAETRRKHGHSPNKQIVLTPPIICLTSPARGHMKNGTTVTT